MKAWEQNFRKVEPYVPGEQPQSDKVIKLNTNENPYPPAPKVAKVLDEINYGILRKYPDFKSTKLNEALAKEYNVKENQIFAGVGSDDVLSVAFLTFFNSKKPILFPDVTYSFYKVWAELYHIPYKMPMIDDQFQIRKEDYYEENGGIVIANPNAPTSIYMDVKEICDILDHNQDVIVIVDEAYIDFGGESMLSYLDQYENLLIVRTFSKSRSMAGMRIGFAIGHESLIKAMNDVKYSINSYTMNTTAIELGAAAVEEKEYYEEVVKKVIDTRRMTTEKLSKLGFEVFDSSTNFVFAKHRLIPAVEIFEELKKKEIYVRYFSSKRVENYLRITIGTNEEMDIFLGELERIIESYKL